VQKDAGIPDHSFEMATLDLGDDSAEEAEEFEKQRMQQRV
jgi:hypothetical protein